MTEKNSLILPVTACCNPYYFHNFPCRTFSVADYNRPHESEEKCLSKWSTFFVGTKKNPRNLKNINFALFCVPAGTTGISWFRLARIERNESGKIDNKEQLTSPDLSQGCLWKQYTEH